MTPNEILKRFPNASRSTLARNPALAGLPSAEPEQGHPKPLVQKEGKRRSTKGPLYRVTLISCRAGRLDEDNLIGGTKALRDAIADVLQCDDNEQTIDWCYGQAKSESHGTIARIEQL